MSKKYICNLCSNTFEDCEILKLNCGHSFNWLCIHKHVIEHLRAVKICPSKDCNKIITNEEIRQVLSVQEIEENGKSCVGLEPSSDTVSTRDGIAKCDAAGPLVPNTEIFTCGICSREIGKGRGIMLRNCFENICRDCLREHVIGSEKIPVDCPFMGCKAIIDDRECREILPDDYKDVYNGRCLDNAVSRGGITKTDRCRKPDCSNRLEMGRKVKLWKCALCNSTNCVTCNVIHVNQSCNEYKASQTANRDREEIERKIRQKLLMRCPDCGQLINKTSGCNWIPCPGCRVELCWITQQRRWGPNGPGDTSGGCRCMVYGPCAPGCGGCQREPSRGDPRSYSLPSNYSNISYNSNNSNDSFCSVM